MSSRDRMRTIITNAADDVPIIGRYSVRCYDEFMDGSFLFLIFFRPAAVPQFICTIKVHSCKEISVDKLTSLITAKVRRVIEKHAVGP